MQTPNAAIRAFVDINPGEETRFTCTITQEMVDAFAKLSGDTNPLHTDEAYAKTGPFGQRVAHGMLAGALFSRLVGMYLPGLYCIYLSQTLKFKSPIYLNVAVEVHGKVLAKSAASRTLTVMLTVIDIHTSKLLVEGEALVSVTQ